MKFEKFASMIANHVDQMSKRDLFVGGMTGDEVYDAYLTYFPPGENEIYRERPAHDCSSCKQFIRKVGNLVSIKDGEVRTIWDVAALPYPYDVVAGRLSESLKMSLPVGLFKTNLGSAGVKENFKELEDGDVQKWSHLHCTTFGKSFSSKPATEIGESDGNMAVIRRGLDEISLEAIDTVLELISPTNSVEEPLYRGIQNKKALLAFRAAKVKYAKLLVWERQLFILEKHSNLDLRIRNTSIGQLLVALSDGADLEAAVTAYELMVAPQNYRRSTAPVSKMMVSKAMEKLEELGLTSALERRAATIHDIPLEGIQWTSRPEEIQQQDSLLYDLMQEAAAPEKRKLAGIVDVSMMEFITTILPKAQKLEILFDRKNTNRLVSLTTAVHGDSQHLFSWPSPISWGYRGDTTDAIKQLVKAAGGRVGSYGRVSLSWFNTDDLDLHIIEPNGSEIYYMDKNPRYAKGCLDVDTNAASPFSTTPVENVFWETMVQGEYRVKVHNYTRRNSENGGFELQIEVCGDLRQFSYKRAVGRKEYIHAFRFKIGINGLEDVTLESGMEEGAYQKQEWGLTTGEFYPVRMVATSPNHWGTNKTGHKHWLFMVEECRNPDPIRGIYNEYLRPDLQEHRKVFELVGEKTKAEPTQMQLSGFGFSETVKASCVIKADGRPYRVLFANNVGEENV